MMYIPNLKSPYPDELLISYICRTAKMNGADLDGFASTFLMTHDVPADATPVFSEFYKHLYRPGDMAEMFLALTTFSFEAIAMSPGQQAEYILAAGGDPVTLPSPPLFHNIRICPECAKEDVKAYGEPYYHRVHNLPDVSVCHKHHVPLLENRGAMGTISNFDLSKFSHKKKMTKAATDYADYAAAFFQKGYTANALTIKDMIARAYREKGYAVREGITPPVLELRELQSGIRLEDPDNRYKLVEKHQMDAPGIIRFFMSLYPDPEDIPLPVRGTLVATALCPACGSPYLTTPAGDKAGFSCPECAKNVPCGKRTGELVKAAGNGEYELTEASSDTLSLRHFCGRQIRVPGKAFFFHNARCSCTHHEDDSLPWDVPVISDNHHSSLTAMRKNEHGVTECIYHKFLNSFVHAPIRWGRQLKKDEYEQMVRDLAGDEYSIAGEFKGAGRPLLMRHNSCGTVFKLYHADAFFSGTRCPACADKASYARLDELFSDRFGGRYKLIRSIHGYDVIDAFTDEIVNLTVPELLQEATRPTPSDVFPPAEICDAVSYWDEMYSLLLDYLAEHGGLAPPYNLWYHGRPLGLWRKEQFDLLKAESLPKEKADLLLSAGVVPEPLRPSHSIPASEQWIRNCDMFARWVKQTGSGYVPSETVFEGERLGRWVKWQKSQYPNLSQDKIDKLLAIDPDFFKYSMRELQTQRTWDFYKDLYARFVDKYGADELDSRTVFENAGLGVWASRQKTRYRQGMMGDEQAEELLAINPHFFDQKIIPYTDPSGKRRFHYLIPPSDAWDDNLALFKKFVAENGPVAIGCFFLYDGKKLGNWIQCQRHLFYKGELSDERAQRMLAVDPDVFKRNRVKEEAFDEYLAVYRRYADMTGSSYVQQKIVFEGVKLGVWYHTQCRKYRNGELSPERVSKMLSVGDDFLDPDAGLRRRRPPDEDGWDEWCRLYEECVTETGELHVKNKFIYKGRCLGSWYHSQLGYYKKGTLSDRRLRALHRINPGVFKLKK